MWWMGTTQNARGGQNASTPWAKLDLLNHVKAEGVETRDLADGREMQLFDQPLALCRATLESLNR